MPNIEPSFGRWLKQRRKTLDLTQQGLADLVGCSAITIRKIESDSLRPSTQIAERLAACCNVPTVEQADFVRFARAETLQAPSPAPPAPLFAPDTPPHNLAEPPTPLIDREQEREHIRQYLLSANSRLLTLIGPPGVGKSRLALEIAFDALEYFRHGVFFVSLAPIIVPQHVLAAIAQTVSIQETGHGSLLDDLKAELYDKKLLLVLDNFEQVMGAARYIDELLAYCHNLKFLVTSREVLRSRRERRFPVPPLALPQQPSSADLASLAQSPAVMLFVERAQAANPFFELNASNASEVVSVCQQLAGIPLSIELIASRSMLLSPRAMLNQLADQLSILNNGSYDHPPRQRTLRDAISWSFELLEDYEQCFLARLGALPDSATLPAIELICIDAETQGRALDNLAALVNKSLVIAPVDSDGEMRFGLLQVIREYALEQLAERNERELIQARHARFYLQLAEMIHRDLPGQKQQGSLLQLERESYHFRAALTWLLAHQELAEALRLASALSDFWYVRGYSAEGRRWFTEALAAVEQLDAAAQIPDPVWIEALNAAGFLAYQQSDYVQAGALFKRSLERINPEQDQISYARVTHNLALIDTWHGAMDTAIDLFERSLDAWRTTDMPHGIAHALMNLGAAYLETSDFARASRLFDESMAIWKQIGAKQGRASALLHLSQLALSQGDAAQARTLADAACALNRELQHQSGIAFCLIMLATINWHLLQFVPALEQLAEATTIGQTINNRHIIAQARLYQALIMLNQDLPAAEHWLAEAEEMLQAMAYKAGLAHAQQIRARLLAAQGCWPEALAATTTALARYCELHNVEGMIAVAEIESLIHAQAGAPALAAVAAQLAQTLRQRYGLAALPVDTALLAQAGVDPTQADPTALAARLAICTLPDPTI